MNPDIKILEQIVDLLKTNPVSFTASFTIISSPVKTDYDLDQLAALNAMVDPHDSAHKRELLILNRRPVPVELLDSKPA